MITIATAPVNYVLAAVHAQSRFILVAAMQEVICHRCRDGKPEDYTNTTVKKKYSLETNPELCGSYCVMTHYSRRINSPQGIMYLVLSIKKVMSNTL